MKRIFIMLIVAMFSFSVEAQNLSTEEESKAYTEVVKAFMKTDMTTFLGIPVDGTVSSMKQKLVSKGFVPKKMGNEEWLEGEFNGTDVHVWIVTNNNKVYRIMLCDAKTQDEANIKIRFNNLVSQFENNKRYFSLDKYTLAIQEKLSNWLLTKYTKSELINPSEEIKKEYQSTTDKIFQEKMLMKPVWFRISRIYGRYFITMFYDNKYNQANGEDL